MDKTNDTADVRKGRHCVYDLHAHLVFVAKYRHDVFTDEHLKALERIFSDVCASFDCRLEEFNGETDHVHLLVSFRRPWNSADSSTVSKACQADTCDATTPNSRNTIGGRNAYGRPATTREPQEAHR